ncbi:hypothetical protein PS1_004235 [Malus domestica]
MRIFCDDNGTRSSQNSPAPAPSRGVLKERSSGRRGMPYFQQLSSSISSGRGFDTHYYQSLLKGRGLLFADQQLMANDRTARLVRAYASDDGSTFRMDFSRAMMKMSERRGLTGSEGQVRVHCSLPLQTS